MKNKIFVLLYMMIALILICNTVFAAVGTTINIATSATEVRKGDKFTISLRLSGVDSNKPVKSVAGYINYNADVIEKITVDSIRKDSDGKVKIGDETLKVEDLTDKSPSQLPDTSSFVGFNGNPASGNQSRILIDLDSGLKSDAELLTIEFKVKDNASIGEVQNAVKYDLFVITAGSEQSSEISKSVGIKVIDGEQHQDDDNNTNHTDENTNKNTSGGNTNTKNETQNENKNSTSNNTTNNTKNNTVNNTTNSNTSNSNKNTNNNTSNSAENLNKNNNSTNNSASNNSNNKNNTSNSSNANKNDNTTSNKNLPKTGSRMMIIPLIVIIGISIVSFIGYQRIKKYGI